MTDGINLPPLPHLQVPFIEADVSLTDIKVLAQWCERTATAYARAAVLADRERDEALLRQALETLELRCGTHADERKELIPALRERLGEKDTKD